MNSTDHPMTPRVSDRDLRSALEQILSDYFQAPPSIRGLIRRSYEYASSFGLEEVEVLSDNQPPLRIMFKNLSRVALFGQAPGAKPEFLHDPEREIACYRSILTAGELGTAAFYGAICRPSQDQYWLFVEKVSGIELYQIGDFEVWRRVARWLARFHVRFRNQAATLSSRAPLVLYDRDFFARWISRAQEFLCHRDASGANEKALRRLAFVYHQVVARLAAMSATLIHGDFYASNILVQETGHEVRVCPVDWEMTGIGPGLIDLAALAAGKWTEAERTALALTYYECLSADRQEFANPEVFLIALDYCRLHLAIQWLGWSSAWSAPSGQAHDWLSEALALADRLGLAEACP